VVPSPSLQRDAETQRTIIGSDFSVPLRPFVNVVQAPPKHPLSQETPRRRAPQISAPLRLFVNDFGATKNMPPSPGAAETQRTLNLGASASLCERFSRATKNRPQTDFSAAALSASAG